MLLTGVKWIPDSRSPVSSSISGGDIGGRDSSSSVLGLLV